MQLKCVCFISSEIYIIKMFHYFGTLLLYSTIVGIACNNNMKFCPYSRSII